MLIVKNLSVLKKYGFEPPCEYKDYWDYDCGDNRTYIWVDEENNNALVYTPELYGDCQYEHFFNQFDIVFKMLLDGVVELVFVDTEKEEYPSDNSVYSTGFKNSKYIKEMWKKTNIKG